MIKKIAAAIVFLGFVSAIIYGYFYLKEVKKPVDATINAIPPSALLVIEFGQPQKSWRDFSGGSVIWEELKTTNFFHELDSSIQIIDSIAKTQREYLTRPLYVSFHQSGAQSFDWLYTMQMHKNATSEDAWALSEALLREKAVTKKEYGGTAIKEFANRKVFAIVHENVMAWSRSLLVMEETVRQLNGGESLLANPSFKRVYETAGQRTDANLYVNHHAIMGFTSRFLNKDALEQAKLLENYANWTEMDAKVKPNAFLLNGYTHANDSVKCYLNSFKGQTPQEVEAVRVVPDNAAALVSLCFSSFTGFYNQYKKQVGNENSYYKQTQRMQEIEEKYNIDLNNLLLSWIDNEMGVFYSEMTDITNKKENGYAYLKAVDIDKAKEKLKQLDAQTTITAEDSAFISEVYREVEIRKINAPGMLYAMLGNLFSLVDECYYIALEEYIVFGNSVMSMREAINSYLQGRTLSKNLNYTDFTSNLSNKSNIYVYNNIARSPYLYTEWLSEKYAEDAEEKAELLRNFQAIALQVSYDRDNLYYNNIYMRHNPVYKQSTGTLWELELEAPIASAPQIFSNHNTGAKDIFVQDENNTIYLVSNTGKIHWKRTLTEPIIGEIKELDALKNNKYQLMFNTASKLYLVDRNGNDVFNYPIKFPVKATNPVTVMDYDNNRNYRLLVALADNKVYNYDIEGNIVQGWVMEPTSAPVKQPLQHFVLDGKDYIVAVDEAGKVYVVNRRGEQRVEVTTQLPALQGRPYYIEMAKDITGVKVVAADSTGKIVKLRLDNSLDTINIVQLEAGFAFAYQDLNADHKSEAIFHTSEKMKVYEQDGNQLFEFELEEPIKHSPLLFSMPDNTWRIGLVSSSTNQLYLFNELGTIYNDFPLFGATIFTIYDINNDGAVNLITGNDGKKLYTYTIE